MPSWLKSRQYRLLTLLVLIVVGYFFYLNHVIVSRFEARRWNLPSRVYADAYALYNGKPLSTEELRDRLANLNYRRVQTMPQHHGEVYQNNNMTHIYLHSFDYPHENYPGGLISFRLENNRIAGLTAQASAEETDLISLEPELIAAIFDEKMEDRTFVPLSEIPRVLTQAIILIEDERFTVHFGIDPIAIARALFTNIVHGKLLQGGSTLTQQMVKNFFLTHERTLARKLNEAAMALIVEARYDKEEILEVYLNEIYFGQEDLASITGVQEAARFYFSKDVSQLLADEAALLAAIIRSPGLYSPFTHAEESLNRRNLVLKRLLENGVIEKQEYDEARKRALPKKPNRDHKTHAPYFIDFVKYQLKQNYPTDVLSSQGLRIFTTLDAYAQRAAEKAVHEWLSELEKSREPLRKNGEAGLKLSGALIALQPKTGFIRAYVGGRDFGASQFDVLRLGLRQPGSIFKPFVYLTALDPEMLDAPLTLASLVRDEPLKLENPGSQPYTPENYDKTFHGELRLRVALEKSYNVATVWLANEIGLTKVINTAVKAGLNAKLKPYPSLALGVFDVQPLNMAEAYTVFPNNGMLSLPLSIRRVVTAEGEVLEKKSLEMERAFSHDVITLMNKLMQGVLDRGTAASVRSRGFTLPAAGKTGTTSGHRDAWFVGYTPDLLALTWVGYLDNSVTGLSGANGALPIWTNFMKKVTHAQSHVDFTPAENIVIVPIDANTGLLHKRGCGEKVDEYFIEGTEPKEAC